MYLRLLVSIYYFSDDKLIIQNVIRSIPEHRINTEGQQFDYTRLLRKLPKKI